MKQLEENTDRFRKLASIDILTHQYRCARVRNRHASCHKCADACTSGCISFDGNKIVVDHDKCIGCCTCCTVCPTCALEAANPNDATLVRRAIKAMKHNKGIAVLTVESILVEYSKGFDPEGITPIANIGRVEESLLIKLVAAGAKKIFLIQPSNASEADMMGLKTASLVLDTTKALLQAWDSDVDICIANDIPDFLIKNEHRPWKPAKEITDASNGYEHEDNAVAFFKMKVMKDGTLPHFIPDRREELLNALNDLGEPKDGPIATRLWGHVKIDQSLCIGCRLCATFCPTGALFKFVDDSGASGIDHTPGDCVKCMCCKDVCRNGAISVEDDVEAAAILGGEAVERYEMVPEELFRTSSHSIFNAIRRGAKTPEYFFER